MTCVFAILRFFGSYGILGFKSWCQGPLVSRPTKCRKSAATTASSQIRCQKTNIWQPVRSSSSGSRSSPAGPVQQSRSGPAGPVQQSRSGPAGPVWQFRSGPAGPVRVNLDSCISRFFSMKIISSDHVYRLLCDEDCDTPFE